MVTRRRYKSGGAVPVDDNVVIVAPPEAAEPAPLSAADIPAADDNPLLRALAAHDRAEAMQREHQARQVSPVEQHVNSIPGLSDHKRNFLRNNPELLRGDVAPLVAMAHQRALSAGIADDTDDMDRAVMDDVVREFRSRRELTSARARPNAENMDTAAAVAELEREAAAAQHEAAERPIAAPIAVPIMPRRSIPMSAPVSRTIPTMSGQRQPSNTLSSEEVKIARNSFTDPGMSNAEKELLYLRNRQKYQRMKADGSYSDQGGG